MKVFFAVFLCSFVLVTKANSIDVNLGDEFESEFRGGEETINTNNSYDSNTNNSSQIQPNDKPIADPIEPFNRGVFSVYNFAYDNLLVYVGKTYKTVPVGFRKLLSNFASNTSEPFFVLNHILQGKPVSAMHTSMRFIINSTFGLFGFIDIGSMTGLDKRSNDFGATLYQYGFGEGFYVFLIGPSNLRDTSAIFVNIAVNRYEISYYSKYLTDKFAIEVNWPGFRLPISNSNFSGIKIPLSTIVTVLDVSISYSNYIGFASQSLDPYSTVKYAYTSVRRQALTDISNLR